MGAYGSPELYPFDNNDNSSKNKKNITNKKSYISKSSITIFILSAFFWISLFFLSGKSFASLFFGLVFASAFCAFGNLIFILLCKIRGVKNGIYSKTFLISLIMIVVSFIGFGFTAVSGTNSKTVNMTKEEYINSYESISYDDLIRNPDKYVGKVIYVNLYVTQEIIGGVVTEYGYVGNDNGNEWYVHYNLAKGESRIIKGDTVGFYGEFAGLTEMKTAVTNTKVLIPKLEAKYRE